MYCDLYNVLVLHYIYILFNILYYIFHIFPFEHQGLPNKESHIRHINIVAHSVK